VQTYRACHRKTANVLYVSVHHKQKRLSVLAESVSANCRVSQVSQVVRQQIPHQQAASHRESPLGKCRGDRDNTEHRAIWNVQFSLLNNFIRMAGYQCIPSSK